jgi:hypothetical protein
MAGGGGKRRMARPRLFNEEVILVVETRTGKKLARPIARPIVGGFTALLPEARICDVSPEPTSRTLTPHYCHVTVRIT